MKHRATARWMVFFLTPCCAACTFADPCSRGALQRHCHKAHACNRKVTGGDMRWFSTRSRAKRVLLYIGLGLLTFGISKVISGCSDEGGDTTSNGFPQPQVRQSSSRELNTTLKAQITTNMLKDAVTGQTFVIQGPTYE